MAADPGGLPGALYDPEEVNETGALCTLIGFEGNPADGTITAPGGQNPLIHYIGQTDKPAPGVVGYVEEPENP